MKIFIQTLLIALSLLFGTIHLHAQGTAFTYQGRLDSGGTPYSGTAEIQATLWNAASSGTALASNNPVQVIVGVTNGLFVLPLDFGANFPGDGRWLELEVRTTLGAFNVLSPRQQLTAAPYAITASNLSGTLPAAQVSGVLSSANLAGTYAAALTLNNAANSISGSGAGLTALNAGELDSGTVPDARLGANVARTNQIWLLGGNAGTTPGTHFLGTTDNQALELKVNGTRVLRLEPTVNDASHSNIVNVVGGSSVNFVGAGVSGATIGGGGALNYFGTPRTNQVEADFGTVSGGLQNTIQTNAFSANIGGGYQNRIQPGAAYATIGGGSFNTILTNAALATIGGGSENEIQPNAFYATISGGYQNRIQPGAFYATIGGGQINTIQPNAAAATIGGGYQNTIQPGAAYATISGGVGNEVQPNAERATIGGGGGNEIQSNALYATIGGGYQNTILTNAPSATIGGGYQNTIQPNSQRATIGGGYFNTIQADTSYATIGGGYQNTIQTNAGYAAIGGGYFNTIQTNAFYATIGGGFDNTIQPNADRGTIGGGHLNTIQANASYATIDGGIQNTIQTNADYASIGGGAANTIQPNAGYATIGGGHANTIQTNAGYATIGGGFQNTIQPNAFYATIPGGALNSAASYAFAAGHRAKANHTGAFVWGDSTDADFASTGINQFLIRAQGGVGINTASPGSAALAVNGKTTISLNNVLELGYGVAGKEVSAGRIGYQTFSDALDIVGAGTAGLNNRKIKLWCEAGLFITGAINPPSDRNLKQDFQPLDGRTVLEKVVALPVQSWAYKFENGKRHIGPMAQDFHAAFGLNGEDDKHIATVDADGVALAAIQGLNEKVEAKEARITELERRLEKLERLINSENGGAK